MGWKGSSKKWVAVLMSGGLAIAGTAGTAAPMVAKADSPVTLKLIMWTNPQSVAAIKKIDDLFHQKYPNITVDEQDVATANNAYAQLQQTRVAANNVDIMAAPAFTGAAPSWAPKVKKTQWQNWIDAGLIASLDGQPFIKNFYKDALANASTYKGHIYGLETGAVAYNGLYYNEDTFSKYGLKPPKTWQQLISLCNALKDKGVTPLAIGGKDGWPQGLMGLGIASTVFPSTANEYKDLWTGKAKFTDGNWVKVYDRVSQLWNYGEPGWPGVSYSQAESLFVAGQAAMTSDGSWANTQFMQTNPNLHYGYFAIPSDKPGQANFSAGKYDMQFEVLNKSPNKDAAMKWLAFFSQPKIYQIYANATGFIPTQPHIKLQIPGDAEKSILKLSSNFRLGLDQVTLARQGVTNGQPGDPLDWDLLQPQGKLTGSQLAAENQKAWESTAHLNK